MWVERYWYSLLSFTCKQKTFFFNTFLLFFLILHSISHIFLSSKYSIHFRDNKTFFLCFMNEWQYKPSIVPPSIHIFLILISHTGDTMCIACVYASMVHENDNLSIFIHCIYLLHRQFPVPFNYLFYYWHFIYEIDWNIFIYLCHYNNYLFFWTILCIYLCIKVFLVVVWL